MAKKKNGGQENEGGNKLVTFIIAFIIVIIWLAVFALLIKFDVGGFGSGVLRPVLKDVPIINKILPDVPDDKLADEKNYDYDTLDEAIERIKELELELDAKNQSDSDADDYVKELEKENERLRKFEEAQDEFEERVRNFDKYVVYAEEAPDIEEYKTYYEEIEPENAADIYRQVVKDVQAGEKVIELAKKYENMDPVEAASVLTLMTASDLELVCSIVNEMDEETAAAVLDEMDTATAAKVTKGITTTQ